MNTGRHSLIAVELPTLNLILPGKVISISSKMNYLYIAILGFSEECFVSNTEQGLREQVTGSLAKRNIAPFTDDEWTDCVKGEYNKDKTADCLPFGIIYFYKTESRLGEMSSAGMSSSLSHGISLK